MEHIKNDLSARFGKLSEELYVRFGLAFFGIVVFAFDGAAGVVLAWLLLGAVFKFFYIGDSRLSWHAVWAWVFALFGNEYAESKMFPPRHWR